MVLTVEQHKELVKYVKGFIKKHSLNMYKLDNLVIVQDYSPKGSIAEIRMNHRYKDFVITLYMKNIDSMEECLESLTHELVHLYLYELDDFLLMMGKSRLDLSIYMQEYEEICERITHRLTSVFLENSTQDIKHETKEKEEKK